MNPFKAIGSFIAHPKRKTQEIAVQKIIGIVLTKVVRHVLTAAGATEMLGSDNTVNQIVGALTFLGGIGWSLAEGWLKHQAEQKAAAAH